MSGQVFGREAEQQAIRTFLDAVPESAAALVLAGSAGSGKTTLLRAGSELAASRGYSVLAATPAPSDLRLAFAGLTDLLGPHLDQVIGDLSAPQAQALRVALLLATPTTHPPEPRLIATALRSALVALARAAPVLVVVDDVQWLDQPSEVALGFAFRRFRREPIGLLCAQRTDRPGAQLPLELDRAQFSGELIPMTGLTIGALHRMLRTRLGSSFSQPTLRRIEAQSGGNPFIALELGRALVRRGLTSAGNAALPVPETLSGLVDERIAELPAAVLDAARLVAVMPDEPAEKYIGAGTGGAELDAAVEAGLLTHEGSRVRFSHPLLAAAVATAIPPARLRELHEIASRLAQPSEARARHRALATPGPSAAVADDLDTAARAAASHGAPLTAAGLFELAASLTPADQSANAGRRMLDTAGQLETAGEVQAARGCLGRLIALTPPGPIRAAALSQLATLHEDDLSVATELLQQALAEGGTDPAVTAEIRMRLSANWMTRGDQARAQGEARQAVSDAERSGRPELLASCLTQAFSADCLRGMESERDLHSALELEAATGSAELHLSPMLVAGIYYFQQGRLEEAEATLRRSLARAEADNNEEGRAGALLRLSRVAGRRGAAREAAELAASGLEIAEQIDLPRGIVSLLYGCGSAALLLGRVDEARDFAGRGRELALRTGDRPYLVCHEALLGSVDLALGDYPAAAARLGPLARTLPEIGWHPTTQSIAPDVVEALITTGELDDAEAFLRQLERNMRDQLTAALAARCRGLLAAARGDLDAAVSEFAESLRLHERISPHPMDQGRTLLALGAAQRRLKLRSAARSTLSEALEIFDRISAPLWALKARDELARISGRSPGPVELSATELRVAELVARGCSNKEAAAELFVSVRAIESTLTKTYAKLGVRSRTELAARLRDLAPAEAPLAQAGS